MAVSTVFCELQHEIIVKGVILQISAPFCSQAEEVTFLVKSECFSRGTVTNNEQPTSDKCEIIHVLSCHVLFSVCLVMLNLLALVM